MALRAWRSRGILERRLGSATLSDEPPLDFDGRPLAFVRSGVELRNQILSGISPRFPVRSRLSRRGGRDGGAKGGPRATGPSDRNCRRTASRDERRGGSFTKASTKRVTMSRKPRPSFMFANARPRTPGGARGSRNKVAPVPLPAPAPDPKALVVDLGQIVDPAEIAAIKNGKK